MWCAELPKKDKIRQHRIRGSLEVALVTRNYGVNALQYGHVSSWNECNVVKKVHEYFQSKRRPKKRWTEACHGWTAK